MAVKLRDMDMAAEDDPRLADAERGHRALRRGDIDPVLRVVRAGMDKVSRSSISCRIGRFARNVACSAERRGRVQSIARRAVIFIAVSGRVTAASWLPWTIRAPLDQVLRAGAAPFGVGAVVDDIAQHDDLFGLAALDIGQHG